MKRRGPHKLLGVAGFGHQAPNGHQRLQQLGSYGSQCRLDEGGWGEMGVREAGMSKGVMGAATSNRWETWDLMRPPTPTPTRTRLECKVQTTPHGHLGTAMSKLQKCVGLVVRLDGRGGACRSGGGGGTCEASTNAQPQGPSHETHLCLLQCHRPDAALCALCTCCCSWRAGCRVRGEGWGWRPTAPLPRLLAHPAPKRGGQGVDLAATGRRANQVPVLQQRGRRCSSA